MSAIVVAGLCALLFCTREPGFLYDDVFYADAGRSLIEKGLYGIQGLPEVNQPPGLSALLGLLCASGSCSHLALVRAMSACATLGLIAGYLLLRREAPPSVAAGICMLLATAMPWVEIETRYVYPCFPFVVVSLLALLSLRQAETAKGVPSRVGWSLASCALVAASILVASAGIALVGAMVATLAVVALFRRKALLAKLKVYGPAILVGLVVEVAWMHRRPVPLEWPEVPGYPASYLEQLTLRSGNQPQLGLATPKDVVVRVGRNFFGRSKVLAQLMVGRWLRDLWTSAVILGAMLLVTIGWTRSILDRGGGILDWYFAAHEAIYLLWPWDTELRFFVAVAPLAGLYLWRGLHWSALAARHRPRVAGLALVAFSTAGLMLSTQVSLRGPHGNAVHGVTSIVLWSFAWATGAWMAWSGPLAPALLRRWRDGLARRPRLLAALPACAAAAALVWQADADATIFRENLHPLPAPPPVIEAAEWIRTHAEPEAVVMARHVPIAHSVSGRKVVWFPPISDPEVLMRGIRRLGVSWVILENSSGTDYYLPPDFDCFASLLRAFPSSFEVAFRDGKTAIYRVKDRPL